LASLNISHNGSSTFTTPYRSGHSIDSVIHQDMSASDRDKLCLWYQSIVGSLNWLVHTMHPDLSTIVSVLAQHQCNPSPGYLEAALYVVNYLSTTKTSGIYFTSTKRSTLSSFLHFPVLPKVLSMSDANWGPQDASQAPHPQDLPLFVSRSMSAFYIDFFSPLHWLSKHQSVTAGSSAEAEIYATDECIKFLTQLVQIFEFLDLHDMFMPGTNIIYNDNQACINWSKRGTTKGLHHIQMKENRVCENIASQFVQICHIDGKLNLADIFTEVMKALY
jgi:hypothetical protein